MADKGSKVMGVYSTDAHLYTPGLKRVGGPLADGGKPAKTARYTVTDLLPEDEQGQLKWRGAPEDTFSDWTIEVVFEGPVARPAPAPAPEVTTSSGLDSPMAKSAPSSMVSPEPVSTVGTTTVAVVAATPEMTAPATPTPAAASPPQPEVQEVIEIQTQTNVYHVHRYFLAFGTRRSEYFRKVFNQAKSGISAIGKTKLDMEPLAAKAFPDLLDFLYDPVMPLVIETETATALHHLGVLFEMEHLKHYAKEFCQKDLSLETLETYYGHAKLFDDTVVLELIVEFLAKNISSISSTSAFVKQQTDATLWKATLDLVALHPANFTTDLHLSKIVAEFGVANRDLLTADIFQELVSELKIRKVDASVAFALCDLEDQLCPAQGEVVEVSSLQQRCATALAEVWRELDTTEDQVKCRRNLFLVDLLGKCLHEARTENDRLLGPRGPGGRLPARAGTRSDRVESQPGARGRPTRSHY